MKGFAFGKYVPFNTWMHRLDARVKLAMTIFLMVALFLPMKTYAMTFSVMGVLALLVLFLVISTKATLRSALTSLKSLWFMLIFLMAIYVLVPKANPVLGVAWSANGWTVYWDCFADAGKILARLVLMILLAMALTSSTKPLDLTYALEWYLKPFKWIGLPTEILAMTISIALRFIPTLLEDAMRVMKAQASRGVDFGHGHLVRRLTGLTSLIIPLFVSSFLRSEELANAMECRGYDPSAKRTRYRVLRFQTKDYFVLALSMAILGGVIYLAATSMDLYSLGGLSLR